MAAATIVNRILSTCNLRVESFQSHNMNGSGPRCLQSKILKQSVTIELLIQRIFVSSVEKNFESDGRRGGNVSTAVQRFLLFCHRRTLSKW